MGVAGHHECVLKRWEGSQEAGSLQYSVAGVCRDGIDPSHTLFSDMLQSLFDLFSTELCTNNGTTKNYVLIIECTPGSG